MTDNTHDPATSTTQRGAPTDDRAARDHIRLLRERGGSYRAIARAAGLGTMTIHDLATVRRQPEPVTVTAILGVRSFRRARVDVGGTRLRLRALHVMGHGSARLARATGASEKTIRALVTGDARTVSTRLRDTVTAVYETWWDKRAPERSRAERAAARAARRRAIAGNWCAAAALDDDQLDTPGYKPARARRPATGTGTATDIGPPRRAQARRGA
jgi:hypothetical protein